MSLNSSIKDLKILQEQFHQWKQQKPQCRIPKQLWNCALDLLSKYSIDDIAKSVGFSPSYVRLKQRKKIAEVPPKVRFVEIQPSAEVPTNQTSFESSQIRVNIHNRQGVTIELSFQGSVDQAIPIISSLFMEGKSCSR
jgi:hypothetical protein